MVDVLKDDLKYVHVFVITFHGLTDRFDQGAESMVTLFTKMFGDDFWYHVMIAVTFWNFSQDSIDNRHTKNLSEEKWAKKRIAKLNETFPNIPHDAPLYNASKTVFIDTWYKESD